MYLTVVILLIETQRSMADVYEISLLDTSKLPQAGTEASEDLSATLGHLSRLPFAVGPMGHSTMGNGAEPSCSRALQRRGRQEHSLDVIPEVKDG